MSVVQLADPSHWEGAAFGGKGAGKPKQPPSDVAKAAATERAKERRAAAAVAAAAAPEIPPAEDEPEAPTSPTPRKDALMSLANGASDISDTASVISGDDKSANASLSLDAINEIVDKGETFIRHAEANRADLADRAKDKTLEETLNSATAIIDGASKPFPTDSIEKMAVAHRADIFKVAELKLAIGFREARLKKRIRALEDALKTARLPVPEPTPEPSEDVDDDVEQRLERLQIALEILTNAAAVLTEDARDQKGMRDEAVERYLAAFDSANVDVRIARRLAIDEETTPALEKAREAFGVVTGKRGGWRFKDKKTFTDRFSKEFDELVYAVYKALGPKVTEDIRQRHEALKALRAEDAARPALTEEEKKYRRPYLFKKVLDV